MKCLGSSAHNRLHSIDGWRKQSRKGFVEKEKYLLIRGFKNQQKVDRPHSGKRVFQFGEILLRKSGGYRLTGAGIK